MYIGTSEEIGKASQVIEKHGAAYVTRTRDPIITNNRASRQTAVFLPTSAPIYPIWAAFVRFMSRDDVHRYIAVEVHPRLAGEV